MKKSRELKLADVEDIIREQLFNGGSIPRATEKAIAACARAILAHEKRVRRRRYADVRRAQY